MNDDDLRKVGQLLDEKINASEERLEKKLGEKLDEKLALSEGRLNASIKQLSTDIGDFISDNLFPMIEAKADKSDIERLERKIDRVLDTSIDHESRMRAIEEIPVVAHELTRSK